MNEPATRLTSQSTTELGTIKTALSVTVAPTRRHQPPRFWGELVGRPSMAVPHTAQKAPLDSLPQLGQYIGPLLPMAFGGAIDGARETGGLIYES